MRSSRADLPDYSGVTETPGDRITAEAASMAVSRYDVVRRLAVGRRVLEVACGSGQGLGYVGRNASSVIGGDITFGLLARARRHYGPRHPLIQFDAHALPFRDESFDLIELHEAVYYMADPAAVARECRRLLAPGGILVISSINPEWPDFNPSPHARRYLALHELGALLETVFSRVDLAVGFPVSSSAGGSALVSLVKRLAVRLGLIPKTMRAKRLLKRLFLGRLVAVPAELPEGLAPVDEPRAVITRRAQATFKILYAIARV